PPVLDTSQHRPSRTLSAVRDDSRDPYAFSRVGNRLFGAGGATHSSPSQISYQETSAPLTPSGISSILPSYSSPATALSVYPPSATQSSTAAPSFLDSTPAVPSFDPPAPVSSFASSYATHSSLSSTTSLAPQPLVANIASTPSSAYAPLVVAAQSTPPVAPGNSTYASGQVTRRDNSQFPTEADVDELYAFLYNNRGPLPPHAASSYSSLAGALSEPGPSTSRNVYPRGPSVGSQDVDARSRDQPNNFGEQFTPRAGRVVPAKAPPHEVLPPSTVISSAISGPSRPRKRKATTPPPGVAEHVEGQSTRGKRSGKGKGKGTAAEREHEPEPESASEPEGADEDAEGSVVESKEALRSRRRRGRRKDLIRNLYEEMEKSIRVEPFETLSLDEVVQLAIGFLKARKDHEQQRDEQIQELRDALMVAQRKLDTSGTNLQTAAPELDAMKQERDILQAQLETAKEEANGLRVALATRTEESCRYADEARRNAEGVQRHAEESQRQTKEARRQAEMAKNSAAEAQQSSLKAQQFEIQALQYKGLAKQCSDKLAQKECDMVLLRAELQRYQEHYPRP
ncbi:hypothetical protein EVG20_g11454, partial [Dentipellis fragilis]